MKQAYKKSKLERAWKMLLNQIFYKSSENLNFQKIKSKGPSKVSLAFFFFKPTPVFRAFALLCLPFF